MAFEYLATCAKGAEKVLARELAALRVKRVRPLTAGVSFAGTLEDGYRALLWLRTASRVLLVLGRVDAACADALYEGVLALPWEEHVNAAGSIAVDARGTNDELRNTQFVAVRVKDAVCDRLREVRGERPRVDRDRPSVRINVALRGSRATIALDLAGEPLHRRGYRRTGGGVIEAPLKETLAATMLLAADWSEQSSGLFTGEAANAAGEPPGKEQSHFLDPLCGSGTLAIEAGLIAFDIAPGIARDYWGFTGWLGHEPALWDALLDEADRRAEAAAAAENERLAATGAALIYASDFDPAAVKVALDNAKRAGLAGRIAFEVAAVEKVQLPDAARLSPGLLACNPPYGERLATSSQLPALYAALAILRRGTGGGEGADGASACDTCDTGAAWTLCAITPDDRIDTYLGAPTHRIDTYNGPLEAAIRVYGEAAAGPPPASPAPPTSPRVQRSGAAGSIHTVAALPLDPATPVKASAQDDVSTLLAGKNDRALSSDAQQFANRLRKMATHRAKWARRSGITCYRVYDADLPDYAVALDIYQGTGPEKATRWLHIAEYAPPAHIDPAQAAQRLAAVLQLAPHILDIPASNVFLKTRERAKGGSQYAAGGTRGAGEGCECELRSKPSSGAASMSEQARPSPAPRVHTHNAVIRLIEEGGLRFEIDLSSRLDTGIFLDHRDTRALLQQRANGQAALNLFAYTGTASAFMAAGGATSVTTVDLSATYLAWAQRNMERNRFKAARYRYEQADALRWVQEHRHDDPADKYGLIFVDPPTFSNSARMGRRSWDVQRDHAELLIAVSRLLVPGGVAVFSTNLRTFKPDTAPLTKAGVALEDITAQTIPPDFERNRKIHHCYLVTRAG